MPVFTDHLPSAEEIWPVWRGVRQKNSTDTESTEQKKLFQPCGHTNRSI